MKRFSLQRNEDITGVSGTGKVAEGVLFSNGGAVVQWLSGEHASTVIWPAPNAMESIYAIHGHAGATEIVWED